MKYAELLRKLAEQRHKGTWAVIAKRAGLDYGTVSRIARGSMPNPGVLTVERLEAAISELEAEKAA